MSEAHHVTRRVVDKDWDAVGEREKQAGSGTIGHLGVSLD
jgi:hypothetical protein